MKQYLDLLQKILDEGVEKESARANLPNTIGISKGDISMNLQEGFPLLTTKKLYTKAIIYELLWFLHGDCNIKYLVDNNVNIWNSDAYRWYLKFVETLTESDYEYLKYDSEKNELRPFTMEEFVDTIKNAKNKSSLAFGSSPECKKPYLLGDLGKIYGYQWRNQNGVDQVQDVLDGLKNNPYSRYHIIDAWNKADFRDMALPPCHLLYQFIVRPLSIEERWDLFQKVEWNEPLNQKSTEDGELSRICDEHNIPKFYLDLNLYQRSVDTPLGCPFNIASMALLLMIFAKASNMIAGIANWIGGDTHIYVNQIKGVKEQLSRTPYKLPQMKINKELNSLEDILELKYEDFELIDYQYHPPIKFELSVGLKK